MKWLRVLLISVLTTFVACGSCGDVDKKGDPFKTTEGDMGEDMDTGDVEPDDMPEPVDVPIGGDPTLDVTPESLQFLDVQNGTSAEQTFTVTNAGGGVLEISSISLVEVTTGDPGGTEFSAGGQWANAASLEAGESLTLSVLYAPVDLDPDAGYVELRTNDASLEDGIQRVSLSSEAAVPDIAVTQAITFQRVAPVTAGSRDQHWQIFEVRNIGSADLDVADVVITPADTTFSVSFPQSLTSSPSTDAMTAQPSIAPNDSMPVRVYFNPIDTLPETAELFFFTNDPDTPQAGVSLSGNVSTPCIQLSEENQINFGTGAVGSTSNRTLIIENCSSTADLDVSDFDICTNDGMGSCIPGGVFDVNVGTLGAAGTIGPRDTATLVLSYSPTELVVSTGMFTISSDDPAKSTINVPVRGEGTDGNACPQAVADARVSGTTPYSTNINTTPLQTVELRGTNSSDADGTVASYQWSIIQRPVSSTATLTPSNDVASPQLFVDLAGTFLIELQVVDDDGATSCGSQALVRIEANPDEDIHVQLVWDTPTDANQSDASGTDMDLHFLHPNGAWNNAPWDIYWLNPTADWGAPGGADDPSLDIDDTDGAGPENINLNTPEAGITYAIGVYYYADNGFGPSYATLRVYTDGALTYEYRDQYLQNTSSFWYAATISWPSGDVFAVNQVTTGFP